MRVFSICVNINDIETYGGRWSRYTGTRSGKFNNFPVLGRPVGPTECPGRVAR